MEHHKISKLLDNSALLKFVTRKWIEVYQVANNFAQKKYIYILDKNNREFKTRQK